MFTSQFVVNLFGINFFAIPFFGFGEVVACLFGDKCSTFFGFAEVVGCLFNNVLGPSPSSTANRLQHERNVDKR